MSEPKQTSANPEKTFAAYSKEQGKAYAQYRFDYHESLYKAILDHHSSTGGKFDTLVDVGCGPGTATRTLAAHFTNVIGLDPSEGMIATARSMGDGASSVDGSAPKPKPIRYEISSAEELGSDLEPPVADSSVDLITAATCAHWFDMKRFWPRAAKVLSPTGSIAVWVSGEAEPHPDVPNAKAITAALKKTREESLLPYYEQGNLLSADLYANLVLPWKLEQPVEEFDEESFFRREWSDGQQFYSVPQQEGGMDLFEKVMGTVSTVTRWREAHPGLAGTDKDVVRMLRLEIERLLHEAGVEPGKEKLWSSPTGVLLIVKKKTSAPL